MREWIEGKLHIPEAFSELFRRTWDLLRRLKESEEQIQQLQAELAALRTEQTTQAARATRKSLVDELTPKVELLFEGKDTHG